MKIRIGWVFACAVMAAGARPLWSQPVYAPSSDLSDHPTNDSSRTYSNKRKNNARRSRPVQAQIPGTDKQTIEAYLQGRLAQLQKINRDQGSFGRRLSGSWDDFWAKMFKERKLFEVRVARQRLDLFDSLGSLDPASHAAAIADFERLQSNVIKSFEEEQRQKMADFFARTMTDLKDFSVDQEKQREDFMAQSLDAWQTQKGLSPAYQVQSVRR